MDGHVLGTLCAVTMALLTNRLDLCIQGLFGAGKSKSDGSPHSFFFSSVADVALKARSLHENKLEIHLYKDKKVL